MQQESSSYESISTTAAADTPPPVRSSSMPRWMFGILGLLLVALIAPSVAEKIQYGLTHAQEQAKVDVAREGLHEFNLSLTNLSTSFRLVAQAVGPSVVNVRTHRGRGHGQGSGVIVDETGYIVTNHHVVEGVRTVEIQLSDGRVGVASVIGSDLSTDMAVLKTEMEGLVAAPWGDSDDLYVGDMVWALGSPFGLQRSISFGIVSAKERRGINGGLYQEFLQTDAAVNPGNSGGPLVNIEGKIVGINTAIVGQSYQGVSFSIPSLLAREIYEKLRKDGWIERGYLGMRPGKVSDKYARRLEIDRGKGVLVVYVKRNTPADQAGLQRGDVILSWDGQEVSDPTLMSRSIAATPIGSTLDVEIIRDHSSGPKRMTLEVTVAAKPRDDSL